MFRDDQLVELFARLDRIEARCERVEEKQDYMISLGRTHSNELMEIRRDSIPGLSGSFASPILVSLAVSLAVGAAMWGCH